MTDSNSTVVRFAPSPTGRIHIGNIRTALYNWLYAKKNDGQFILRLDDTDQERSTQEFADAISEDLNWLGIVPDRKEKQSDRIASYDEAAQKLREAGLLYPCYETPDEIDRRRKRQMARGLPPVYDRSALKLSKEEISEFEAQGRTPHWRFLLPNFEEDPFAPQRTEVKFEDVMRGEQTVDLASMSDPVLIRGDGTYLYTLPSVVDDIEMGVTHVIRGGDHITNTGAQIALFKAVGGTAPKFGHHNLLTDVTGDGLSKRKGALSISSLREDGLEPMSVSSLATLIGTGQSVEACTSMDHLAQVFLPEKVSRSPAKFDPAELLSLNEKLLHGMAYSSVQDRLIELSCDHGEAFWEAVKPNLSRFKNVALWGQIVDGSFEPLAIDDDDKEYISTASSILSKLIWSPDIWKELTGALKQETGRKGRALFMPLRKVLTGQEHGPDMAQFLPVIGQENALRRLS